jgi:hypothetical protein
MTDILAVAGRVWDYLGPISHAAAAQHVLSTPYAELRREAQYFEFGPHMNEAMEEIAKDITTKRDGLGNGVIPQDAQLPAPYTVICFEDLKDNMIVCNRAKEEPDKIRVSNFSGYMPPLLLGGFTPGSAEAHVNTETNRVAEKIDPDAETLSSDVRANLIVFAAACLTLINTPRLIKLLPAGTRQARRAMGRKTGSDVAQWHRIEWDLTKPQMRAGEKMGSGWHMPLHYTRGHWRQNDKAKNNAYVRADGKTYQWIEGYWSGHPAYGIKRAVYAPRIGEKVG